VNENGDANEYGTAYRVFTVIVCSSVVQDSEGNGYCTGDFGDAGKWMTMNLRSTKTLQGEIEQIVPRYVTVVDPQGTSHSMASNGFDALLTGYTSSIYGTRSSSSYSYNSETNASSRSLTYNSTGVSSNSSNKGVMYSVRCKENEGN
jgi:hypothetical protein